MAFSVGCGWRFAGWDVAILGRIMGTIPFRRRNRAGPAQVIAVVDNGIMRLIHRPFSINSSQWIVKH